VLVVRNAAEKVRCLIVGYDGSAGARRAVRFVAKLEPRRGSVAVVVTITELLAVPRVTQRLPSSMRASLRSDAIRSNRKRARRAQVQADAAASILERAGWAARAEVRAGAALETLLAACADLHADVLVIGARAGGVRRAPLGSVSTAALNHSLIPVLIVP
jgi:nucleotide-binding universal stress UspA family protein